VQPSIFATADAAEDVAELAELFLVDPDRLDRLAARYPQIAAKRDLLVDFWAEVAPEWDPWRRPPWW
jgi:hypothetical protein